ncbi:MAG: urease accessory protein UreD [Pseudomonadales bacterium]|nr:urease accessory protein UreD [Pseudomonadales bacterium]
MNKPLAADALPTSGKSELSDAGRWSASLSLQFSQRSAAAHSSTRLSRCRHQGPLYVQKPFYPEGDALAHVYILHPPGGVVSGDQLSVDVSVETAAQALITTPGAGRIYRARQDRRLQQQHIHLQLAEAASLEWLPLETIVFNDANVSLTTRVDLAASASFIGWDVMCFGLPASQQWLQQGQLQQSLEIYRQQQPLFIDRLHLDAANMQDLLHSPYGFGGHTVSAIFICCVPELPPSSLDDLAELLLQLDCEKHLQLSELASGCVILRYLGDSAEQARLLFTRCWQLLRPLSIAREACLPRIWST